MPRAIKNKKANQSKFLGISKFSDSQSWHFLMDSVYSESATVKSKYSLVIPNGVYITNTTVGKKKYHSVTFVGVSKTFNYVKPTIETHILHVNFHSRIRSILRFHSNVTVEFLEYLRPISKFENKAKLAKAIEKDIAAADNFFTNNK
ncbi:MAG: riboflavin kinase [Alphaproteobacteria bacterium]|nr:riboflavin kinase [Alphaproteobacteria bacterium]